MPYNLVILYPVTTQSRPESVTTLGRLSRYFLVIIILYIIYLWLNKHFEFEFEFELGLFYGASAYQLVVGLTLYEYAPCHALSLFHT